MDFESRFPHHTERQLLEEMFQIMLALDADVQAATTVIDALVAKVTDLEAQLAAATGSGVSAADQTALEGAVAAGNAVLAPSTVPSVLTVPAQTISDALGTPVSYQVTSEGGTPSVTFVSTDLPAGLTIDSTGLITGSLSATGSSEATVTATDSTGATATGTVGITVS